MSHIILNAGISDLQTIYRLFEEAILFQKNNNYIGWSSYDKEYIRNDLEKSLLFKMVIGDEMICIFSICYSDVLIWREKEKDDAVYLHRIVLNQKFKGEKVFQKILAWAKDLAKCKNLKHIRMDTWAENAKIIGYYKSYGFRFVEDYTTPDTENLPIQHRNLNVALLEMTL